MAGVFAIGSSVAAGFGCSAPPGSDATDDQDLTSEGGFAGLEPNDVSILWPVHPDRAPTKGYLKLFPSESERGPAFPRAAFDDGTFPRLLGEMTASQEAIKKGLVVVGMRVTACDATHTPGECVPQLRLIAQPIQLEGSELTFDGTSVPVPAQANDATNAGIHVIYKLTDAQLDGLVGDLAAWGQRSPVPTGGRLSIHPGLERAGVDSDYAHDLSDIVLRYATKDALVRVTFSAFSDGSVWTFSAFDRDGATWKALSIPGLPDGTRTQVWTWNGPGGASGTGLDVTVTPPTALDFAALTSSAGLPAPLDDARVGQARANLLKYENPRATNAETVDCVGCHLAQAARDSSKYFGVSFDGRSEDSYRAPAWMDATSTDNGSFEHVIAFGYRASLNPEGTVIVEPAISQRVVNDTAEAVLQLRARHASE